MDKLSKENIVISLKNIQTQAENQYFDRKEGKIKSKDLAKHISAFANANGGYLVIGVADNGDIIGFENLGMDKFNNIQKVPRELCVPVPRCNVELYDVINKKGNADKIIIFDIQASNDKIIKTSSDEVYLRIGDTSRKLTYEEIKTLEYDKGERLYEDEVVEYSSIDDIDTSILDEYRKAVNSKLNDQDILEARGLLINGKLTVAGTLLFAKNPDKYLSQAKFRFIRYEGIESKTGTSMNVIKDQVIYGPLHKIIVEAKSLITSQLRDFQSLNPKTGKFQVIPEYPEFAWQEGIVNAITHRDYSIKGEYIKVFMYDDRLEINSPGHLPNIVNLSNLKNTRYSRNPRIARILSEFGWVKELNEGVKRIYEEMSKYFLEEPYFDELKNNIFQLKLKNNIKMRKIRNTEKILEIVGTSWKALSDKEKKIIEIVYARGSITSRELAEFINRSVPTARKDLNRLVDKNILKQHKLSLRDPKQYYTFKE